MNIDFNTFFRMRVDVSKVKEDQYQLVIERVNLEDSFYTSKSEFYLSKEQLTDLVKYFQEIGDKHGIK
jgi:hypothetical protein